MNAQKMPAHEPIDFGAGRYDTIKEIVIAIEPGNNGFYARLNILSDKGYELNSSDWRRTAEKAVKLAYYSMVVEHIGLARWHRLPATLFLLGGVAPSPKKEAEVEALATSLRKAYTAPKVDLRKWARVEKGLRGSQVVVGSYPIIVKSEPLKPAAAKDLLEETRDELEKALAQPSDTDALRPSHLFSVASSKDDVGMLREIVVAMRQGKKPGDRADHLQSDYF
jgi:hypothetical protein